MLSRSDKASLKLQEIENRLSKRKLNPGGESLLLRSVQADAVVESSRSAAEFVQTSLTNQLENEGIAVQSRGVKQALLYVLLDSQVPAVLVECFYLSNKSDIAFVADPQNRERIAEGIAKGVLRFLATR